MHVDSFSDRNTHYNNNIYYYDIREGPIGDIMIWSEITQKDLEDFDEDTVAVLPVGSIEGARVRARMVLICHWVRIFWMFTRLLWKLQGKQGL